MTEREAFEGWVLGKFKFGNSVEWHEAGPCLHDERWPKWHTPVDAEWSAWQAASARCERLRAKLAEAVGLLSELVEWGNTTGANMNRLKDIHSRAARVVDGAK